MKKEKKEELIIQGLPISGGVGIGFPVFFSEEQEIISERCLEAQEVDHEVARYREALNKSRKDLEVLQKASIQDSPHEISLILGTHLQMMQDPVITQGIEAKIRETQQNTATVFQGLIEEYKERFRHVQDTYFEERVKDIVDVSRRILGHLLPIEKAKISEMPHNSIILTQELAPSETIEANPSLISAFVTAVGGMTSHAAIIARAKGIPCVAGIDIEWLRRIDLHSLIVDGSQGIVVANPSQKTLKKYQERKKEFSFHYKLLEEESHFRGETIDGYEVKIFANVENPKEVSSLEEQGAAGVGLFRSEYLFLTHKAFPSEEEQFQIYKKMVKALKGKPFVLRVFDVGGDKQVDLSAEMEAFEYFAPLGNEANPALGCRAIRFLLRYPEILKVQLKAVLRAGLYGEIQLLLPMISDLSEIYRVKELLAQAKKELLLEKKKVGEKGILIGCMIEVPSSALMADEVAKEVDFLSIGTNDLVQYTLAVDRNNPHTSDLYFAPHPSILRFIRMVVASATKEKKPVVICGEMAADPLMIPVLMGLGVREFSVSPRHIPLVKKTIRQWRFLQTARLAEGALEYATSQGLKAYLSMHAVL